MTNIEPETLSAILLEIIANEDNGKPYVAFNSDEVLAMVDIFINNHSLKEDCRWAKPTPTVQVLFN